jgi:hypothetical protein
MLYEMPTLLKTYRRHIDSESGCLDQRQEEQQDINPRASRSDDIGAREEAER